MSQAEKLTAVSLFSGGGGLDLGVEATGFTTLFATDNDHNSCETLRNGKIAAQQRGKPFLSDAYIHEGDICDLEASFIRKNIGINPNIEIDLLIGGPPCQPFSVSGKRLGSQDPDGKLIFEYVRIVKSLKPRAFLFENVLGLLTTDNGSVYKELNDKLAELQQDSGYKISELRLNAVDYGVPQFRDRLFFIGHLSIKPFEVLHPIVSDVIDSLPRRRTVADALKNLPSPNANSPKNHIGRRHGDSVTNRYKGLASGARDPHSQINKLDLTRPSFTIVVGSENGGGKGHIHPLDPREVTPRESARIQTFPDWWSFCGNSKTDAIRQIGNAVPPLMAAAISNEIRSKLFGLPTIEFSKILNLLDQTHLFET